MIFILRYEEVVGQSDTGWSSTVGKVLFVERREYSGRSRIFTAFLRPTKPGGGGRGSDRSFGGVLGYPGRDRAFRCAVTHDKVWGWRGKFRLFAWGRPGIPRSGSCLPLCCNARQGMGMAREFPTVRLGKARDTPVGIVPFAVLKRHWSIGGRSGCSS